ncbi:MAG: hypothetical protein C7B47_12300 [Sulfobacillus thermosulfidooxidans]|uniref:GGDEF domain-containing protein n=1 Tax=Sulfobacillus thermosulfidooxidans TaxID=28034 RepID=A0A2T2WT51_SULTH|nr:MAG: hypothetical protein C7B47_12300 [Sulfobacillus thermosulfidooxidans]
MREVLQWVLMQCATWARQPVRVHVDGQRVQAPPLSERTVLVQPLPSIFSDLSLFHPRPEPMLYVSPTAARVPYPRPIDAQAFQSVWQRSVSRVITQCALVDDSLPRVLERVLAIINREWAGFGMTMTPDGPVVPLPLYLRVQVAWSLAAQSQQARLVYGDFSGIQSYVFARSRLGVSAVAKTLRARSARISLMALGVPWAESVQITQTGLLVLSAVGGGFTLLLPPTASLAIRQAEINAWLHEVTHAQMVLHTAEMPITADQFFGNYMAALSALHAQVAESKRQPLASYLFHDATTGDDPWVWRSTAALQSRCVRCESYPPLPGLDLCHWCALDERLGGELPRMRWIQLRDDMTGMVPMGNHWSLALNANRPPGSQQAVYALNDTADPVEPTVWMNLALPIATTDCPHCQTVQAPDPVRAGQPYTFACLAALDAPADPRLGYLKVDVDHLGLLMTVGLVPDTTMATDIYRVLRLQDTLDRFFTEGVRQLMQETRTLYTVFSGGDDLYVIGGARQIAAFSLTLAERFADYTGYHPDVTLSAGLVFVEPHVSIAIATEAVERALHRAKNVPSAERVAAGIVTGRNQVTIGTTTVGWTRYRRLWEEAQEVARLLDHRWLSHSGLYRLLQAAQFALQRPAAENAASWFPRATYEMHRHYMGEEQQPVRTWLAPYLQPDNPDLLARLALFPLLVSLARIRSQSDPTYPVQGGD